MTDNALAFAGNAQLPAHLRGDSGPTEFDTMGGVTIPSIKVRVTGIKLTEGETVLHEAPPASTLDVVIIGASPVSRSFYKSSYNADEASMPDCRSYDGIVPDASVEEKQSDRCDTCPMNAKGSSRDNLGGRACRFRQNLAVILPSMPDKVFRLAVASTSIFPKDDYAGYQAFRPMVGKLRTNKLQPFHVVTQIRQHPASEQTHTVFKPVGYTDEVTYATAMRLREDTELLDTIYGKFDSAGTGSPSSQDEDEKDAQAFDALHGTAPAHITPIDTPKTTTTAPPTKTEAVKKAVVAEQKKEVVAEEVGVVLGYTPYTPTEVDTADSYWSGVTVTRQLGEETVSVVIEVLAGQPLPDEEWEETDKADYERYSALVLAHTAPKTGRQRKADTATPPASTRSRRATQTEATGVEAGATTPSESALSNALDNMFDNDDDVE